MDPYFKGSFICYAASVHIKATAQTNSQKLSLQSSQVLLFYEYIHRIRGELLHNAAVKALLIGLRGVPMKAADITKHVKRICKGLYPGRQVTAQTIRQSVIANLLKQGHDLIGAQIPFQRRPIPAE